MREQPPPVIRASEINHAAVAVDPRQLECFIAVAEELNLNRAALRLRMSQPPLTRRIKRLEREVGVDLFRRTSSGMALTEPGTVLLDRAYRIVALSAYAVDRTRRASAGEVGHLSIGYYDSAILDGIPALLSAFLSHHPDVTISFQLVPKHAQVDYLRDRLLHVGFGRDYPPERGIVNRVVGTEPLYLAIRDVSAPPNDRAASISDLRGMPLALYPDTRPGFADQVIHLCLAAGFAPIVAVEAGDVVACLAYVAIGAAAAVVPRSAARTRPRGVSFIPLAEAAPASLQCITTAENSSPSLRLFTAFVDNHPGQLTTA
jgi:LysR family transcriptional regulator, benzoate and cis,cis-muconate-responsive activator of ben and cat genes